MRQQIQQKSLNFQTIPKNSRAEEKSISNISLRPICWVLAHLEILRAFKGVQTEEKTKVELLVLYLNASGVTAPKDLAYLLCNGSLQGGFDAIKV